MIHIEKSETKFKGDVLHLSAEMSILIENYLRIMEDLFDTETAKALFESAIKTAFKIKEERESENGETET